MSVTAFIRRCLDVGMPLDMALKAAEAFEQDPPISKGAMRTRRYRERKASQASPVTVGDGGDKEITPEPPKENNLSPPLKGGISPQNPQPAQPEKPLSGTSDEAADDQTSSRGARRKPNRPLPDGFPTAELIKAERDKAILAGIDLDATREAERFRNHAQQTDRRCADWTAAWRNWTLKAREWAPKLIAYAKPAGPDDPWPRRLLNFRINGSWDSDWGPKPGKPGYLGPPDELTA